ncbi:MAG: metallophosphoesterase [Candidatus Tritonobacter lacicola]|nr:metallophosphoesterase [Candidatus Tritonobacter lacicola]
MKTALVFSLLALLLLAAGWSVYTASFLIEPNWPSVEDVAIGCPELVPYLGGLRILLISDLHIRWIGFREEELIRRVASIEPDVILITGDIIGKPEALDDAIEVVRRLRARIWKYGVYGEDERFLFTPQHRDRWKAAGLTILEDRAIQVDWKKSGNPICLIGVDTGRNRYDLEKMLNGIPGDMPKIMIAHSPTAAKPAALAGIDLIFAGDTHGGQIGIRQLYRFSGYARDTAYRQGLFKVRRTFLYVSRGMGWSLRPVRFLCRPEITVVSVCEPGEADTPVILPGDEV